MCFVLGIKSETLTGRSGVIQFVINLEVAINESISLVNIIPGNNTCALMYMYAFMCI